MSNDAFLVMAHIRDSARSANGNITSSAQKFRGPLKAAEEVARAVTELWDETQWFLICCRDKWARLQSSDFVADNEPYSSKERVASSIKKLLDDGAVGILVGGGNSGGDTVFLQFLKEV